MQENDSRRNPLIQHPPLSTGQTIFRLAIRSEDTTTSTKEIKPSLQMSRTNEDDSQPVEEAGLTEMEKQALRDILRRLSLYPHVVQRPMCEAVIKGKKMQFQVIGKRGDQIRIKHKRDILNIMIDDIRDFKIIQ